LLALGLFAPSIIRAEDTLPKDIAARLEAKWLTAAKRIQAGERVIYYHGTATPDDAAKGDKWSGQVEGEILVLTPSMATACGKFRLTPTGGISISGPQQMKLVDGEPPWKKLLQSP
jgi:hypothetical protein